MVQIFRDIYSGFKNNRFLINFVAKNEI